MLSGQWLGLLLNARVFYKQQGVRHPRQTDPWIRVPRKESSLLGNVDGGVFASIGKRLEAAPALTFSRGYRCIFFIRYHRALVLPSHPEGFPIDTSGSSGLFPFFREELFSPLGWGAGMGVS